MKTALKSNRIKSRREEVIQEALRARKFSKIKLFKDAIAFVEEGLEIANKKHEILGKKEKN